YHGSMGDVGLEQPVAGIGATPSGDGYWLAAADGAAFAFGDAVLAHSLGEVAFPASQRVVGIAAAPTGHGFWLASSLQPAPNPKVEAAIAWFTARIGVTAFEGQCELAVENAYGTASVYATAFADWHAQP